MIELKDINKIFPVDHAAGGSGFHALSDINLHVQEGEFVSIIGPSGCGKSTLLNIISGILPSSSGKITVDGLTPESARLKRHFGMVFQKAVLLPWRTAFENVLLPLQIAGLSIEEAKERCFDLLDLVGLTGYENHWIHQLSGGMQQRVSVARALSFDPPILLMDEPFGALDDITRRRMDEELLRIWKTTGKTILFVTHNIIEAVYLSQRVVVMSSGPGRIREISTIPVLAERSQDGNTVLYAEHVDHLGQLLASDEKAPLSPGEEADTEAFGASASSHAERGTPPLKSSSPWWRGLYERAREIFSRNTAAIVTGATTLVLWESAVRFFDVPRYLLPAPSAILLAFVKYGDLLLRNTAVTLVEILLGFIAATVVALLLAMAMILSQTFRNAIFPYLIASQTTPHIAWAALLLIWLGFGITSKIVVVALVAFFPVVVNAIDGMDSVDAEAHRLFQSLAATRRDVLLKLQIPYGLTHIFSGLRVAMAFSVVGAVIAEWVGAERGLGVIIIRTMFDLRVDLLFAIIIILSVLGTSLFALVGWIETLVVPWRESTDQSPSRYPRAL